MSAEHDWPNGDYMGMTCCICGVRFSGPHNAPVCYLHRGASKVADGYGVPWVRIADDNAKRIAELEAELASLKRRIAFFGVPEKLCLLCGAEGPCGLRPSGEDGKPDWTAGVMCQFDPTYPELIAIAHKAESEVAGLRKRLAWLQDAIYRNGCQVEMFEGHDMPWRIVTYDSTSRGDTFDAALDVAMVAEERGKAE